MKRRDILRAATSLPVVVPGVATATAPSVGEEFSTGYFHALPDTKAERNDAVIGCANSLCQAQRTISETVLQSVVEGTKSVDSIIRRLTFGVRTLNEYNITTRVDEAMIEAGREDLSDYTRYIPLVQSFNNLCSAACAIKTPAPNSEAVRTFLVAAVAFGAEVALWTVGAPYKIAWSGTRYIANRTLLRFARHGCRGCIALLMSELHWAIRGSIYGEVVTEGNLEFVWDWIQELQRAAERWDYDVDLAYSYTEVRKIVESRGSRRGGTLRSLPQEREGPIERLLPEFPNFDIRINLPSIWDLIS